ncbi:MAG: pyruvate, phosphate dikinase [Alphaproteobacteria bacterium]|nr:pyruvate, phosphate dikinase [Alphaproteobacteria bacterium]
MSDLPPILRLGKNADVPVALYGARANRLSKLRSLGLPVPLAFGLSIPTVNAIATGQMPDKKALLEQFGKRAIVSVRSSPGQRAWGGPGTMLNVGLNDETHAQLRHRLGDAAANVLYCRFVQDFSVHVAKLDAEAFDGLSDAACGQPESLAAALAIYQAEMDEPFPQDPVLQLGHVLRSMARAWSGTTARILRQARGAPVDAGLGLIVQRMAIGLGSGESGAGVVQFVKPSTGESAVRGRYLPKGQGLDAMRAGQVASYIATDKRGTSLETTSPKTVAELRKFAEIARMGCHDVLRFEFTIEDGKTWLLDAAPANRSPRAAVQIAVDLALDGAISRKSALLRVEPQNLQQLLHPQIDPDAKAPIFVRGLAASPGAATGRIVFSAMAAQASAAREEACIMVRQETSPEDIRGMHVAKGVLTQRGGMNSHAALIARGHGLPCVVGASDITLNFKEKTMTAADGQVFIEGDIITVDGTNGVAMSGEVAMVRPDLTGAFATLMDWAREFCDIGIRANADTASDARMARSFGVDGIGLCRTEHMFFEEDRLTVMREMIFADDEADRRAALDRLLPMQRGDFVELFEIMQGLPVTIRLFDPPLHEFLPHSREAMQELAEAMDLPVSQVTARAEDLTEFNPMLGMRGVRLGILMPEIYDMQARAIFEATVLASQNGAPVVPEIMIPLVSAAREVELVKARLDAVAREVQREAGVDFTYRMGVMVETPRAALRSGELAANSAFLSFGTNDLTQMTYGLSRDDAGRFMSTYVNLGVFPEDPFHTLDLEGVGELLLLATERGRAANPDVVLSVCGEHGGDPTSIGFCRAAGFDYVSCSPFRVPIAYLAAAQSAVRGTNKQTEDLVVT